MRGKKAKKLRKIAYADSPVMKYARNREYMEVESPGQWRHRKAHTIIADHMRHLYQTLKGRRPTPHASELDEMLAL